MQAKQNRFTTPGESKNVFLCLFIALGFYDSSCFAVTFTDQTAALVGGGLVGWQVAWGDYNSDGYVDLLMGNRVYRNNGPDEVGNWSFEVVFSPEPLGAGLSGIWGDYDNDGDLDIYSWGRDAILRYDGGTTFTEVDLPVVGGSYGASWGDYDNNGWLDLYVAGGGQTNYPNAMLANSNGTFTKLADAGAGNSRGVTTVDVDRDGDLDIYVSNYWQGNNFFRNPSEVAFSFPFADVGLRLGETNPVGYTSGSAFGDFDNDGNMDAITGNLDHGPQESSSIYRNLGPSDSYHFSHSPMFRFDGSDHQEAYNSPSLGDYDNDGDLDILMGVWQNYGNGARLYRNDGNWNFTNVTADEGLATDMGTGDNDGAAWADFDNDGDLDLVAGERIWVNSGNSNHWLKVKLTGDGITVNRAAIGSTVRLTVDGKIMTRQVEGATGISNQNDLTLHFGLGSHSGPVDLEIFAPGGGSTIVEGVAVDQTVEYATDGTPLQPPVILSDAPARPSD